jgi:prepilin-type N-terminal cleavage/methylation domain-containing protein
MRCHQEDAAGRRSLAQGGFTIIESMVASAILLIGLLGVLAMLIGSLRATNASNARVAATNLTRELVEATRGLAYDDMTGSLVQTRLQARGLGSGTPWTIERRGTIYTLVATSCTFDDPADKLAATPPAGACTPAPTGTTGDLNGEDFRRTTFRISWTDPGNGRTRVLTQTTLVLNPTGGLGPRIVGFAPVAQTITAAVTTATVTWTTTPAVTLRWLVDDGRSSGTSLGTTSFATTWDIGTSGTGSEVLDGSYQITAVPLDDRDIAGEGKRANVVLNRRRPYAPPSLAGGHNTRPGDWVELQWDLNSERDVLGYRVWWNGPDGTAGGGDDVQVCPAAATGQTLAPTTTSCVDTSPPAGATTYQVVALDRSADGALREGDRRSLTITPASARPRAPTGLAVRTVGNLPQLTWTAPSSGSVRYYRIYRDAVRYDRTSDATTGFTDSSAGTTAHVYWITAVDPTFNESDVLGPVLWLP